MKTQIKTFSAAYPETLDRMVNDWIKDNDNGNGVQDIKFSSHFVNQGHSEDNQTEFCAMVIYRTSC